MYKTIKERLNPALVFEGRSMRAKRSERMTSAHSLHDKLIELGNDAINEGPPNHTSSSQSSELVIDYGMLNSFKAKKYDQKGRVLLGLQIMVFLVQTFYEMWLLGVNTPHVILRFAAMLLLCLSIYKYT